MSRRVFGWAVASLLMVSSISVALAEESTVPNNGLVLSGQSDPAEYCPGPCPTSRWEAKLGFVYLQRSGLPSQELARGLGSAPQPFLDADQFSFDFEGGPDLTIVRHGDDSDIEFRWFQVHDSIAKTPTIGRDSTGFGFPFRVLLGVPGSEDGIDLSAGYRSQMSSFELNLKRPIGDWISVFGGFRFVELNELLSYSSTPVGGEPLPMFVRSFNDLYGFQLGSDIMLLDRGGPFKLVATGKAGIYANYARNQADQGVMDSDDVDSASTCEGAFLGEIGLNCTYQITPRLAARVGYEVMWINGVALASQQQPRLVPVQEEHVHGSPSVAAEGTAFYHGVAAGLDFRF